MSIQFENTKITITPPSASEIALNAIEGSISESLSFAPIPSLGQSASIGDAPSDKPSCELNATYYLINDDSAIRGLTGVIPVSAQIGTFGLISGFLSSYSLSAEPNSLVQASITLQFYQQIQSVSASSATFSSSDFAHGKNSALAMTPAMFNGNLFGFEYSISQSVTPYFYLGETGICAADLDNGSVSISLQGSGLDLDAGISYPCLNTSSASITLRDVCGTSSLGTISESNLSVTNAELTLTEQDGLVGSISLQRSF